MLVVPLNHPMRVVVCEPAGPELRCRRRHVLAPRARRRARCDRGVDHELNRIGWGRLVVIPHYDRLMSRVDARAEDGEADQTATQPHARTLSEASGAKQEPRRRAARRGTGSIRAGKDDHGISAGALKIRVSAVRFCPWPLRLETTALAAILTVCYVVWWPRWA